MRKLVIASETIDQNVDFDVRSSLERSEAAEIEAELRAGVKLGEFSHSPLEFCIASFDVGIKNEF